MDFELFLGMNISCESLAEALEKVIAGDLYEKVKVVNNAEEIVIGTECFSMAIEIEDISDIAFVRSHYELDVNVCIRIQLFGNNHSQGLESLFSIMGAIMKKFEGNLLLLENGSKQLLRKEDGQLIVNNDLDQYQVKYLTASLLSLLNHSYNYKILIN
ncbi:hypothetical protein DNH61_24880 [Paenibacillus sambharensis]|uniref:Uncharacterized protein n=1 Tax=Paenibacillus sambharensis TaxID=1803190 RepID=A0A2W1LF52_9BACL|nr:hypothetical protein [Paenibacillus sambharensis]PZD93024.1 hypothetical protein DNH61_24880 [Paenibacillus sambharensis]